MGNAAEVIRVLCVDDHRVVREGLAALINRRTDMAVIAAASDGEEALSLYRIHRPDVTVMDLQLPRMNGLDAIRAIRREDAEARIIVLTMYQGDEDIYRALEAGAATYLIKDDAAEELIPMIREVNAGRKPLPPAVAKVLATRAAYPAITARELEVLELIAKGMRNKEIAVTLKISEETTKVHVKNLLSKLGVNDRTAAVNVALRRGILHLD
jgi:DNA-binding NarL/FixJ family response regulator